MVINIKELQPIVNIGSYGTIKLHLKEMLESRGITRYKMAKLADTRFEVVNKWCNGNIERIDTDILARFCYILDCGVSDIIEYEYR